jgi:hypothetical protein
MLFILFIPLFYRQICDQNYLNILFHFQSLIENLESDSKLIFFHKTKELNKILDCNNPVKISKRIFSLEITQIPISFKSYQISK